MQMCLVFSVVIVWWLDILIVDEVLLVGDVYFQYKSFECICSFCKVGIILLIVFYDCLVIQFICDFVIFLEQGWMVMCGWLEEVMDYYNVLFVECEGQIVCQEMFVDGQVWMIFGIGEVVIFDVWMVDQWQCVLEVVEVGQVVMLEVEVEVCQDIEWLIFGFMIKDCFGQLMYGINIYCLDKVFIDLKVGECIIYCFVFDMCLGKGYYLVVLSLLWLDLYLDCNFEWCDYGLVFYVINNCQEDFVGCFWLGVEIYISCFGEVVLDFIFVESIL